MDSIDGTVAWLYSLEKSRGIDLKLERMAEALHALGDPQDSLRCIHVAGTNGKGSVAALLAAAASAAGLRSGLYTSPHLVDIGERIQCAGTPIAAATFVALANEIRALVIDRGIELTFFEVLTAMAFLSFARAGVDFAAIEVGLGGRLDATNVIEPLVSVVTSVGIDHAEYLGTTLREIATEKAGIAKSGIPLVIGPVGAEAAEAITAVAQVVGSPLLRAGDEFTWSVDGDDRLTFAGLGWHLEDLHVGLDGEHQRANAAVAVAALAASRDELPIGPQAVRQGLAQVRWPGRLHTVLQNPRTVLDGAHNVDAMRALVREIDRMRDGRRLHVLFTAMGDKAWPQMVEMLAPRCVSAIVTQVLPDRMAPLDQLRDAFAVWCRVAIEREPERALAKIRAAAGEDGLVLVTGSLFLVGKVMELLRMDGDSRRR